jgi:hypothetical protein
METTGNGADGLYSPRLTACGSCEERFIDLPLWKGNVRIEPSARLTVPLARMRELVIEESRSPFGDAAVWVVRALPDDSVWPRFDELMQQYPFDRALILIRDEPVAFGYLAGWSGGVEVGRFDSSEAADRFTVALQRPVRRIPFDASRYAADRALFEQMERDMRRDAR